jgi:hypothetical protein
MSMSKAFPAKVIAAAFLLSQTFVLAPSMVLAESAVRVAGQQVIALPAASASRAKIVQEQLDNALVAAKDKTASAVAVAYVNGLPVITLGGYQVVTVTATDAKDAGTTPSLLAKRWANSVKESLSDQSSISSYVAQLSGQTGSSSADTGPAPAPAPAIANSSLSGGAPAPGVSSQGPTVDVGSGMIASNNPIPTPSYDNSSNAVANYLANANPPIDPAALAGRQPTFDNNGGQGFAGAQGYPGTQGYAAAQGYAGAQGYGRPPGPTYATYDQSQAPPVPSYGSYTPPPLNYGAQTQNYNAPPQNFAPGYRQGRIAYAPAGLVIPLRLKTPISTQVARSGDMVEAEVSQTMQLGDASIPMGSAVVGTVTDAEAGRRLSRSGELGIKFTTIRTPDGIETPINAHLIGSIGKYAQKNDDGNQVVRGEGMTAKLGQTAIRGAAGAGIGAALGTAVGAIASHGYRVGTGAWSGAAIGGGIGVADMALRKGRDVTVPSGTKLQIQLDGPVTFAGGGNGVASGNF